MLDSSNRGAVNLMINMSRRVEYHIRAPLTANLTVSTTNGDAPMLVVTVADTGFGIEEENLSKIFLPFFTAKKTKGLGLGLPICQRIIKNHGGRIDFASQPGKGTTFQIQLPLKQQSAAQITASSPAEMDGEPNENR